MLNWASSLLQSGIKGISPVSWAPALRHHSTTATINFMNTPNNGNSNEDVNPEHNPSTTINSSRIGGSTEEAKSSDLSPNPPTSISSSLDRTTNINTPDTTEIPIEDPIKPSSPSSSLSEPDGISPKPSEASIPSNSSPHTIVLIGNPGVGKSTLLSSLVEGSASFSSGISIGRGKTKVLQREEYNGNAYIDTPGLSDVKLREQAAMEIENAFKPGGNFKVFFVVTLESGRVRPDDVATIKLVLDAVTQIGPNQYSIIINKASTEVSEMLSNSMEKEELVASLNPPSLTARTNLIDYVPINPGWVDQPNKWGALSPQFTSFIEKAPKIFITSEHVQPIQYGQFEEVCAALQHVVQQLREDNAALRRAVTENSIYIATPSRSIADNPGLISFLFIGRTGSGKSTLINWLSEHISGGSTKLDCQSLPLDVLDGAATNEQLAKIKEAFKLGGKFKVFFVATVADQKLERKDKTMIKLVRKAVPQIRSNYSVIVNKAPQGMIDQSTNTKYVKKLLRVRRFCNKAQRVHFCPINPDYPTVEKTVQFLRDNTVSTTIKKTKVQ